MGPTLCYDTANGEELFMAKGESWRVLSGIVWCIWSFGSLVRE